MNDLNINNNQTMLSTSLVSIINDHRKPGTAVLRHTTFMKKIVKVIGERASQKFLRSYRTEQNKEMPCYSLPKRECHLMVMAENYEVQAAVYDHMIELEDRPSMTLTLEDMTLLVIEGHKEKILELENKIAMDKPVTDFGLAISQSAGTCKIGDWIKAVNDGNEIAIGRNKAFALLRERGYLMQDNMPMQSKVDQGLFMVKEGMVVTDTKTIQTFTTLLTGKGQMVIAAKFKEWIA